MPRPRPSEPELKRIRGTWHVVWYDDRGRRRWESTGQAEEAAARRYLADFERDRADAKPALTLGQVLDLYAEHRDGRAVALGRLKEAARALTRDLGHLRLDQVDDAAWRRYAKNRKRRPHWRTALAGGTDPKAGQPVAPGTLRREYNTLRAALRLAVDRRWLDRMPPMEAPPDSAGRDLYWTKAEAARLIAAAVTPHVRLFMILGFGTGARSGAILELTWDRVHLDRRRVDFDVPGRPRTDKRRTVVPMNDTVHGALTEAALGRDKDNPFVVAWGEGGTGRTIGRAFNKAVARAGIPPGTPHVMKHSVVSWFAAEGVPIEVAAKILATDERTLKKVYLHFAQGPLDEAVKALDFLGSVAPATLPRQRRRRKAS